MKAKHTETNPTLLRVSLMLCGQLKPHKRFMPPNLMPYLIICRKCHYIQVSRDKDAYLIHSDKSHSLSADIGDFDIFVISENEYKEIKLCMRTQWFWKVVNTVSDKKRKEIREWFKGIPI